MTRGGKRKNQTGRPKKPYRVKRMSVPEPLVKQVDFMILRLNHPAIFQMFDDVLKEIAEKENGLPNQKET